MVSSSSPLKSRIINASAWTFGGYFLSQVIKLVGNLIITRLLVPEMFGVMAVLMLIIMGVNLLTDLGLSTNVIQSNETEDPRYMNTIWTIQVLKGLFIWMTILILAFGLFLLSKYQLLPPNSIYAKPELPIYLAAISFMSVFSAFEPTWMLLAVKKFRLKEVTIVELGSQILSFATTVTFALLYASIWALVIGTVSASFYRLILTYVLNKEPLNTWCFDKKHVKTIIGFGKWVIFSTMFGYVVNNGDRLMLGGVVSERLMGIHSIAFFYMVALMGIYGKFLRSVAYPALSEAKNDSKERLKNTYYKFRRLSDLGLLFTAGVLWTFSESLISLLYDDRYQEVGSVLKIMGIGLVAARYNLSDQLFLSVNKPKYLTFNIFFKMVALFVLLPLSFKYYGFYGVVWAMVIASFSSIPIIIYLKYKLDLLSIKQEIITLPMFLVGMAFGAFLSYLGKLI